MFSICFTAGLLVLMLPSPPPPPPPMFLVCLQASKQARNRAGRRASVCVYSLHLIHCSAARRASPNIML
uniref:Secreted protein n=1 Tax=Glossina palpalis gambiensis TaxID=67801 RepID=A0A1B0BTL9_9MUSC